MPTAHEAHHASEREPRLPDRHEAMVRMARHVTGRDFSGWPGWENNATIMVALILNRTDVLYAFRLTQLEAMRMAVRYFSIDELIVIQREATE